MIDWLTILGEAAPAKNGDGGGFLQLLIVFGPMVVIFLIINHLLVTRPQQKQRSQHADMLTALKKNDRLLTAGGVIGTFVSISEDKSEVTLRVDDNTRLRIRSEYIRGVLDGTGTEASDGAKSP